VAKNLTSPQVDEEQAQKFKKRAAHVWSKRL
jgi:hypothetical protein